MRPSTAAKASSCALSHKRFRRQSRLVKKRGAVGHVDQMHVSIETLRRGQGGFIYSVRQTSQLLYICLRG
jgi:hypothetical protein